MSTTWQGVVEAKCFHFWKWWIQKLSYGVFSNASPLAKCIYNHNIRNDACDLISMERRPNLSTKLIWIVGYYTGVPYDPGVQKTPRRSRPSMECTSSGLNLLEEVRCCSDLGVLVTTIYIQFGHLKILHSNYCLITYKMCMILWRFHSQMLKDSTIVRKYIWKFSPKLR